MKSVSIRKNFIMNAILTISSVIFPLISFPYVSRVLQTEGIGKVNLAISVIAYFNLFAQLGIPTYGIKACAKVRDDRTELTRVSHELLIINLIMALISYAVLAVAIISVPKLREEKLLYIIVSSTIFLSAIGMEWMYKGVEEYSYITIRSVIFKIVAVIAMFLLIHAETDYVVYGLITVAATGASNILNIINARKYIDFKPVGNYNFKRHARAVLIFFALACTTTIYTNLDNVMLGFMTNDVNVGLYSTAVKIKTVLIGLITSLGAVILPRASYYVEQNKLHEFWKINKKAMNFVLIAAIPVSVFFVLFARESIAIIAGPGYEGAVLPMQIIMPTVLLIGMSNITGIEIMVPVGREKGVLYSTVVGAIVDLILNAIFIPIYGAAGAALGTLIAETAVLIVQMLNIKINIRILLGGIDYWKIAVSVIIASAAGIVIKRHGYSDIKCLVYSAVAFFTVYVGALLILKEKAICEYSEFVAGLPILKDENISRALLISYSAYIVSTMIESLNCVATNTILPHVMNGIRLACYAVFALVIATYYIKGRYSKKVIALFAGFGALVCITVICSKNVNNIFLLLFMAAFCFSDFNRLMKMSSIVHIVCLTTIVLLSLIGIIDNIVYYEGNRIRESFGFDWVTTSSNIYFYIVITWIVWRNVKARWLECIGLIAGAVFLYSRTDTKSAFALSILAVLVIVVLKALPILQSLKHVYGLGTIAITCFCPAFIILYSAFGDVNSKAYTNINRIITGRLTLAKNAFNQYGVTLFGQPIEWVGNTVDDRMSYKAYNYVDSSFCQILLNFGIIFLIVIVAYLIWIEITAYKKRDIYLLLAYSLLVLHTTFDPQLLVLSYHPFLLGIAYLIYSGNSGIQDNKTVKV